MSCKYANVWRNVEKTRLINRRTYLHTEKCCEDVTYRETLGRETNIVRT